MSKCLTEFTEIDDLKEEICALRHNYSILEKKYNELYQQNMCYAGEINWMKDELGDKAEEIEKLKIEVEKIHSRYDIIDL